MHPAHRIYATKFRQLASRFEAFADNPGVGTRAENLVRIQSLKEAADLLLTAFDNGCLPDIHGLAEAVRWARGDDTGDDGKCHLAPCPENVFSWLGSQLDPSQYAVWKKAADYAADRQRLDDHLDAAAVSAEHQRAFTCLALADMLSEAQAVGDPIEDALEGQPLPDSQQEVLDIIREQGPLRGKEICKITVGEESTLRRHIIPALKKSHGIKNRPGAGYYLP